MQKARRHPDKSGLRPLVSVRFQVLFTPLLAVLFTFPSQYWFTIGLSGVFSLSGWCRYVQTGFHRSRPTQFSVVVLRVQDCHLLRCCFPNNFHLRPTP